MTSTQPSRRSWFFRQSWLVQFALVFFGTIALLTIVTIIWGMSTSVGTDDEESGPGSNPGMPATISKPPTANPASPTTEAAAIETGPASTIGVADPEKISAPAAESLQPRQSAQSPTAHQSAYALGELRDLLAESY